MTVSKERERRFGRDRREDPAQATETQRDREVAATLSGAQTSADLDQSQADAEQTASDADRRMSGVDQALADRDQRASDRDQAAADWERGHSAASPASERAHETSRSEREIATRERDMTSAVRARATGERMMTAARRDESARIRDRNADVRDRAADARDRAADARDQQSLLGERRAHHGGIALEVIELLGALRLAGAAVRERAAKERRIAAAERAAAAVDRDRAAADRAYAGLDELTGVFQRGTGELALTQEIARSRRSDRPLTVALIDVDGLKTVNHVHGHSRGDNLLRSVSEAITSTMRAHDVTIRWGGDEFVCVLSDVIIDVAHHRLAAIQTALDALQPGASVSAGLAQLNDNDTLEDLIARAGIAMYRTRAQRASR